MKRPQLTAIIKTSGIEGPVQWIDLEEKRCKIEGGYEGNISDFEFVDSRDYESLRGEYAGRAMQAITTGMMGNLTLMEQMASRAVREGYSCVNKMIAADAVGFADALISELKRPKDYKEIFNCKEG